MEEPAWKKLQLSLERPYKDGNGEYIPVLSDITPEGVLIQEPRQDWATKLGDDFRRIFREQGTDFFEKQAENRYQNVDNIKKDTTIDNLLEDSSDTQTMTPEELFKMRMEIIPRLHIALGEMTHAKELLSVLLSSPPAGNISVNSLPSGTLSSTTVSRLPDTTSLQVFNSQLATGGKDDALRKAASVLKSASNKIEGTSFKGELYWANALRIRRGNWPLLPASLPLGSSTGRGADRTAKDFVVAFGLEEMPHALLRRAVGRLSDFASPTSNLPCVVFPHMQNLRLRVVLRQTSSNGAPLIGRNAMVKTNPDQPNELLRHAQREIVEQEIFAELLKEAGNLPTAAARVSERFITIDIAENSELQFEMVDSKSEEIYPFMDDDNSLNAFCDFIYASLHALLLRLHSHTKAFRLNISGAMRAAGITKPPTSPSLLEPITDTLHYQVFCTRIKTEFHKALDALKNVGIPASLRFDPIGESGQILLGWLSQSTKARINGECIVRFGDRQTIRFSLSSPSSLVAHLPQATITISSISQLCQLLADEIERGLLGMICQIGTEVCKDLDGTWIVDPIMSRCVGFWQGFVFNFDVTCAEDLKISCIARRFSRIEGKSSVKSETYTGLQIDGLLRWAQSFIASDI